MKTAPIIISVIIAGAAMTATMAMGQPGTNANTITFGSRLHVDGQVQVAKNSKLRLGSMKLRGSNMDSNLAVQSNVRLGGPVTLRKNAHVGIGQFAMNNARIGGPATVSSSVQVRKSVIAEQESDIGIGGVDISADAGYNATDADYSPGVRPVPGTLTTPVTTGASGQPLIPGNHILPIQPVPQPGGQQVTTSSDLQKYFARQYPQGYHFSGADYNHVFGHCAWFAEQLTRLPGGRKWTIGNTVADKRKKLARHVQNGDGFYRGKGTPTAGNAVIFSGGTWGHVAVINKVYPDGRIRLTESNRKGDFHVTHDRIINANDPRIMGFLKTKSV
jgi:surface antigen